MKGEKGTIIDLEFPALFMLNWSSRDILYFTGCPVGVQETPLKNMTWILMEIPCHFISQIDGSLVQIHTRFHDYSMSSVQVLFVFHTAKT